MISDINILIPILTFININIYRYWFWMWHRISPKYTSIACTSEYMCYCAPMMHLMSLRGALPSAATTVARTPALYSAWHKFLHGRCCYSRSTLAVVLIDNIIKVRRAHSGCYSLLLSTNAVWVYLRRFSYHTLTVLCFVAIRTLLTHTKNSKLLLLPGLKLYCCTKGLVFRRAD